MFVLLEESMEGLTERSTRFEEVSHRVLIDIEATEDREGDILQLGISAPHPFCETRRRMRFDPLEIERILRASGIHEHVGRR